MDFKISNKKGTFHLLIDEGDFWLLIKYKWYIIPSGHNLFRVSKNPCKQCSYKYLHRLLLNAKSNEFVDHINGNPLDNRKENLRICTRSENCRNSKLRKDNTSGYKGVWKYKGRKKPWVAEIKLNDKNLKIGYFKTKKEAANAYNKMAIKHFGRFARINKI